MTLKFGTDGVRGVANTELTPELALALGRAAARVLGRERWLVGRDTRRSGPLLTAALAAGLATEGASVVDLAPAPTRELVETCLSAARTALDVDLAALHERAADADNRRRLAMRLTQAGRDVLQQPSESGALASKLERLAPSEVRAIERAVEILERAK